MNNKCNKTSFDYQLKAQKRANNINNENREIYGVRNFKPLRPYKCEHCNLYHLTSMHKKQYKYYSDTNFKSKIDKERNIKLEVEYWENIFN